MSREDTQQRLIRIIVDHYLEGSQRTLTIQSVSKQAGISRQSFNRYYNDLTDFVLGARPIEELIKQESDVAPGMLTNCMARMRDLQQELVQIRAKFAEEVENVRVTYVTTLMEGDISLRNSDEIRSMLEKQALHNEKLNRDLQHIQLELTAAKAREVALRDKTSDMLLQNCEILTIEPDLSNAFRNYKKTHDREALEDEKEKAIDNMPKKINNLCRNDNSVMILFVDRYLSDFEKYVSRLHIKRRFDNIIVARVPLFNRQELKLFAKKLVGQAPIFVHVPYCVNESVVKAQRKFSFRNVPDIEFESADKMIAPSVQDGYAELSFLRVEQGD